MKIKQKSGFSIMKQLIVLLKPLMAYMFLAIATGVIGFLMSTAIGALGGLGLLKLMNLQTIGSWPAHLSLKEIGIILVVLAIIRSFLQYAEQLANHFIAFKILAQLRNQIFNQLKKLAPAKLEEKQTGELLKIVTSDIELLEVFYAHTISPICIAIITCSIVVIYLGSIHPIYALIGMIFYVLIGLGLPMVAQRMGKEKSRKVREGLGLVSQQFLEAISGIGEIMQYHCGQSFASKLHHQVESVTKEQKNLKKEVGQMAAIVDSCIVISILVSMLAYVLIGQPSPLAEGFLATLVLMSSFGPVVALASLGTTLLPTLAAGERVLSLLEEKPKVDIVENGQKPKPNDIVFENISFAYENQLILKDYSMKIQKGEKVGICGRSGCGKSTILKLLMRFWDIEEGLIKIGDTPIKEINSLYLRDQISYMTQNTVLFTGTLRDNLKIGNWDAKDEAILTACQKASILDFIQKLPKGLDTWIEDLGENLSGGERQRIGLARCFLSQRPIMLLDEPTSNLDRMNEAVILKALDEECEDKTLVIVSHRDSSLSIVNRKIQL